MNFIHQDYITPYGATEKLTTSSTAALFQGRGRAFILHNTGDVDVFLNFGGRGVTDADADDMRVGADEKLTLIIDNMSYYSASAGELRLTPLADA